MAELNPTEEISEIWNLVKESFVTSNTLSEGTVNLWFGDMVVIGFDNDTVILGIGSSFRFNIVRDKYLETIRQQFSKLLGFEVQVRLIYNGSAKDSTEVRETLRESLNPPAPKTPNYNFEYTFENFIVGSTNKFAQAACVAVADHPATNYNPLFIYGNSGLGKTHLMNATINRMKQNNPAVRVIYTKGEDFTNQMIACLANNTMSEFRDKYRKCDVLLIDDIQFIAGKISTQEEFFHTFNALYEEKKQIILTSDRPPKDIKTLEDRLKSRFEWGLLADIEPPDLELRIAIIKKKAEQANVAIPDDVLTFLAENLRSNIRQLEGAIKKLGAHSFLSGKEITMELAQDCISELLGGAEPISVTVDKIFTTVTNKYGIPKEDLTGNKRNKEIATARHVTIYLIRKLTEMSFPNISKMFGRDHSTIISSYNLISTKIHYDSNYALEIEEIKKEILGQ